MWKSDIQPGYLNFKNNINIISLSDRKKKDGYLIQRISQEDDIRLTLVQTQQCTTSICHPKLDGWSPILEPRSHWEVSWGNKNPTIKKCPVHTPSKHHPSTVVLVLFGPIWCCLKPVLHPRVHLYTGHFIAAGGPDLTWDVSVPEN
jgi:hypothetical protein